jgi:hypothetical protein
MGMDKGREETAAGEFARMLEASPIPLKSLKFDHATLVAKLEASWRFIEAFAVCTCELLLTGNQEDAKQGIEAGTRRFAEALDISLEDSHSICVFLVMLSLFFRKMGPVLETMEKEKSWEEWFGRVWDKES